MCHYLIIELKYIASKQISTIIFLSQIYFQGPWKFPAQTYGQHTSGHLHITYWNIYNKDGLNSHNMKARRRTRAYNWCRY